MQSQSVSEANEAAVHGWTQPNVQGTVKRSQNVAHKGGENSNWRSVQTGNNTERLLRRIYIYIMGLAREGSQRYDLGKR